MERFIKEYDQYRAWLVGQQQATQMSDQVVHGHLRQWEADWRRMSGGMPSDWNNRTGLMAWLAAFPADADRYEGAGRL